MNCVELIVWWWKKNNGTKGATVRHPFEEGDILFTQQVCSSCYGLGRITKLTLLGSESNDLENKVKEHIRGGH